MEWSRHESVCSLSLSCSICCVLHLSFPQTLIDRYLPPPPPRRQHARDEAIDVMRKAVSPMMYHDVFSPPRKKGYDSANPHTHADLHLNTNSKGLSTKEHQEPRGTRKWTCLLPLGWRFPTFWVMAFAKAARRWARETPGVGIRAGRRRTGDPPIT